MPKMGQKCNLLTEEDSGAIVGSLRKDNDDGYGNATKQWV